MPRTLTKTYDEREQIAGPVRSFLARFIQISTIVDMEASPKRIKELAQHDFDPETETRDGDSANP